MSISGKIYQAIERGESIGCSAIQIFTKSNRQWDAKPLNPDDVAQFKQSGKKSSIQSVVVHASYLINIGSPNQELAQKSLNALEIEFQRCAELEIPYLILHPGSYTTGNQEICLDQISKNIDILLTKNSHGTILLETMAGQASQVGYTFEQLATIIKKSTHKHRIGICIDTCHLFAAGYDLRTEKSYRAAWEDFDKIIGINKIKVIHINDSAKELGSRVDRHAEIGKGKMGLKAFELLLNDPMFFDVPKILETPNTELSDYKRNLDVLQSLLNKKTRDLLRVD